MSQFTEAQLEQVIIKLLSDQGYPHYLGDTLDRAPTEVLLKGDFRAFLSSRYAADGITPQRNRIHPPQARSLPRHRSLRFQQSHPQTRRRWLFTQARRP